MTDNEQTWGDDPLSPLGQRRHRQLTEWATRVARGRELANDVRIASLDDNARISATVDLIEISLRPTMLDDATFAPRYLRAIAAHELGHAKVSLDQSYQLSSHEREFAADAFAASVVGIPAMIRALRFAARWGAARREVCSHTTATHPSIDERVACLRKLK
ncbi:MAG: hypothetical protein ABSC51_00685 [Gaiellaceae bacterium]|jgi:hypothetical protein